MDLVGMDDIGRNAEGMGTFQYFNISIFHKFAEDDKSLCGKFPLGIDGDSPDLGEARMDARRLCCCSGTFRKRIRVLPKLRISIIRGYPVPNLDASTADLIPEYTYTVNNLGQRVAVG
jgi:hypothetical protein